MVRHRNPNCAENFRRKGLPMPRTPSNVPPPYPKKPHNGQARITVRAADGRRKDLVLGPHGSAESLAEYRRVLAELGAHGGHYPVQPGVPVAADLTVNEVLLQYWRWAEEHYRDPEGNPSRELVNLKDAVRPLKALYGHTPAREFGPTALRALQQELVKAGLCRSVVNFRVNRIRRVFKWAASFELLPVAVHQALQTVPGLRRGHGKVREADPVQPVLEEHVNATLPFLPAPVRAMVELQRLTGCRPGEVMAMRAIDLTMTGLVWTYRPASHKNRHRGLDRVIFLGPLAQTVVKPFLTTELEAYLFSPRAAAEAMRRRRAEQRKTKRTPSELRRQRKATPKRKPADRYTRVSYRQAIVRACNKAGVPEWSPLQLRHTAATAIRAKFGVEAAKVILGHTKVETTQIYAERDLGKAKEIMAEIG
jgi:integrase